MGDCVIFVDDGFLKLVKKEFSEKYNFKPKLFNIFRNLCENEKLGLKHLFFCTAPPFQSSSSTKKENQMKEKYDKFVSLLKYKKWITVREGRCQRLKVKDKFEYFQKGVDSWIVFDLARFKINFPDVKKIILISSDSDFAPIIKEIIKSDGLEIILYTYFDRKRGSQFSLSNHLINVCSRWVKFRKEDFE